MKKLDDSHEFLPIVAEIEEEPINPIGRTIFWILIALIFFTALWLTLGKADIVVLRAGKLFRTARLK